MNPIDAALAKIDAARKKLSDDFWRDMAKLNADERKLLGLRPVEQLRRDYDPNVAPCDDAEFDMKP